MQYIMKGVHLHHAVKCWKHHDKNSRQQFKKTSSIWESLPLYCTWYLTKIGIQRYVLHISRLLIESWCKFIVLQRGLVKYTESTHVMQIIFSRTFNAICYQEEGHVRFPAMPNCIPVLCLNHRKLFEPRAKDNGTLSLDEALRHFQPFLILPRGIFVDSLTFLRDFQKLYWGCVSIEFLQTAQYYPNYRFHLTSSYNNVSLQNVPLHPGGPH